MLDLFSVKDKVVLVTGGSRSIGEMIAEGYVANGAKVYISSRKASACDKVAARLSKFGPCIPLPADLSNDEGVASLASALKARECRLDILVNNAGAAWGAPLDDYPSEGWSKVMYLNLTSAFFLTQGLLPSLRAAASPASPARVVNVASVNGLMPPMLETYAYSSSKAGLIMLTRHLAKRLAPENISRQCYRAGPVPDPYDGGETPRQQ